MIKDHCFSYEWIDQFKKQKNRRQIDPIILQKMIYALHLLEQLQINNLEFVFKGGTSLVLLLDTGSRFSIDIDIICKTERNELERILDMTVKSSQFTKWELDEHRSYQEGIPKAHYRFHFDAANHGSGAILLDVLIEDCIYPETIQRPVTTRWIDNDDPTLVIVPSIDSITGDKLTAFAPNTIGIPYFKGTDNQSFSMEICKQLFDLSKLFENIENVEEVMASFEKFALREIGYRENGTSNQEMTPDEVLQDTINTCVIISKRGGGNSNEKLKFAELQKGIRSFGNAFLMEGHFRLEDAIAASARIAYLAAKIRYKEIEPIAFYEGQDIKDLIVENISWNFLNKLKKLPDKSAFYYWYQATIIFDRNG